MSHPEAASTVFVGSISPGVPDRWLTKLLEACGGFRRWKRVSKAFGFADYQGAPDILRVTAVLHDVELPSMGAEYGSPTKRLVVKADEKTNRFLGEFEKTLVRTDLDRQKEREARRRVEHLLGMMRARASDASEVDVSRCLYLVSRFSLVQAISGFELYHAGDTMVAEVDVVLPLSFQLKEAHDLGEIITYCIESLSGIERAYIHLDYNPAGQSGHIGQRG